MFEAITSAFTARHELLLLFCVHSCNSVCDMYIVSAPSMYARASSRRTKTPHTSDGSSGSSYTTTYTIITPPLSCKAIAMRRREGCHRCLDVQRRRQPQQRGAS